jgi:hypothetical protein
MSNLHEQNNNLLSAVLARSERLCGRFPVLSSEDPKDFQELLISLLECYRPRNFFGEKLIRHLADEEWDISRLRRYKNLLLERRFRACLTFQAYREKATQEDNAALAKKLAEQPPGQLILPEQALEDIIAKVDALLLRPAEEIDHARAQEVAIVFFQHLDRLLNAAIARRNAILEDIDRYDFLFNPSLSLSAIVEDVHEVSNGHGSEWAQTNACFDDVAPARLAPPNGGQS